MTVGPGHEEPREGDAVTASFGDPSAGLYGLARTGVSDEGARTGMGLLFAGGAPIAARADAEGGGVELEVVEPLRRWRVAFDGGAAGGFALELEALAAPAALLAGSPVADLGGMEGYEQLCRVRGTVRAGGAEHAVDCLGQRGHSWGRADWGRLQLARTVSAWLDERTAITAAAVRPAKAKHHADEALAAFLVQDSEPLAVADPRLSTTYDGEGRQHHAGLELWVTEDGYPHRAAGEVVCGTTLDLGALRLDCAFLQWRMEGRTGVGRYDLVRRNG